MYIEEKIGYPRTDKYKILDEYLKTHDRILLSEMPEFTNRLKSLHSACLRCKIPLIKVNNNVYIKGRGKYDKKRYIYKYKRPKKEKHLDNYPHNDGY